MILSLLLAFVLFWSSDKSSFHSYVQVNASAQFCGVAEMVGPVDFDKSVDYWQQDKWSGQFPVKWQIIKDVPNSQFRHIVMENNDNKPVTNSRDTQEVCILLELWKLTECLSVSADLEVTQSQNWHNFFKSALIKTQENVGS